MASKPLPSCEPVVARFPLGGPPSPLVQRRTRLLYIVIDDGEYRHCWVNPEAPRLLDATELFEQS